MQSEEKIQFMSRISSDCSIINKTSSIKIAKSVPLGISLRPNQQSLYAIKDNLSIKENDYAIATLINYHQSLNIPLISRAPLIDLYWKADLDDSEKYKDIIEINSSLSDAMMLSHQISKQFIVSEKCIEENVIKLSQEIRDEKKVKNIMDLLFYIFHLSENIKFLTNKRYENSLTYDIINKIKSKETNSLLDISPLNVFREISLNPYDYFATFPCATLDSVSDPTKSIFKSFGEIKEEKDPLVVHLLLSLLGGSYSLIFFDLSSSKLLVQCPFFLRCSKEKHSFKCSNNCIKNEISSVISKSCTKSLNELERGSGEDMDQKLPEGLRGTRIGKMIGTEGRYLPDAYTKKYISKTTNLMQKKEEIAQIEIDFLLSIPIDSINIISGLAKEIFSQFGIENMRVEAQIEN